MNALVTIALLASTAYSQIFCLGNPCQTVGSTCLNFGVCTQTGMRTGQCAGPILDCLPQVPAPNNYNMPCLGNAGQYPTLTTTGFHIRGRPFTYTLTWDFAAGSSGYQANANALKAGQCTWQDRTLNSNEKTQTSRVCFSFPSTIVQSVAYVSGSSVSSVTVNSAASATQRNIINAFADLSKGYWYGSPLVEFNVANNNAGCMVISNLALLNIPEPPPQ